jgi:zinc transport system substrate-binding protein
MKTQSRLSILVPLALWAVLAPLPAVKASALAPASAPQQPSRPQVAAIVPPHAELVRSIGGPRFVVQTVVAPGESPASFDPTPRRLAALADAVLLFRTGVPLENALVPRLQRSIPEMILVDLREGLDLLVAEHDHHAAGSAAGAATAHRHETDPHIWLSPRLLAEQVRTIADALAGYDPAGAAVFAARRDSILGELAVLDRELSAMLAPIRGQELFVFHPAFGYLARDYGLDQFAIEEGGLSPSPRHLARVLQRARERGTRAIFIEPQFSSEAAARVARELDLELVVLDPLAPDVTANLRRMARAILDALEPAGLN